MNYFKPSVVTIAGMLILASFLLPITACQAENLNNKIETKTNSKATLIVSITDSAGTPLSGFTAILANTRMTMIHKTVYSGNSPFEAPIGTNEKWQVVITDYVGDTIRVLKYDTGPGSHRIEWDLNNDSGERMEDGVYFVGLDSPSYSFPLGTWGIWNYSEINVVMPLYYKRIAGSRLEFDNLISTPDTLNVFFHHILYLVEVGSPYYLHIFKDGYEKKLVNIDLVPGKTTRLSVALTATKE